MLEKTAKMLETKRLKKEAGLPSRSTPLEKLAANPTSLRMATLLFVFSVTEKTRTQVCGKGSGVKRRAAPYML